MPKINCLKPLRWSLVGLGLALWGCYAANPQALPVEPLSGQYAGTITLQWTPTAQSALANFGNAADAVDAGCSGMQLGTCCAYLQPSLSVGTAGARLPATVSVGAIQIDDAANPIGVLNFKPYGYLPVGSLITTSLSWNPGDRLSVTAPGQTGDGFSAAVTAPPPFEGVTPELSYAIDTPFLLARDFQLTWTPGAPGTVWIQIVDETVQSEVDCAADDSAGAFTIPSALFVNFAATESGLLSLIRPASTTVTTGNVTATLLEETSVVGNVHFQ